MPIPAYLRQLRAHIHHDMVYMGGVLCVVLNQDGEVLAQERRDDGNWCLPGGIMDPNEEIDRAAEREVFEETGVEVVAERIIGVYPNLTRYPNGDVVMLLEFVVGCRLIAGEARVNDDESLAVGYFPPNAIPVLDRDQIEIVQIALRNEPHTDFRVGIKGIRRMGMSEYVRKLREKIGHDILFMPAAAAVFFNGAGQILLQGRSDNGQWSLPGGAIAPGEEPADAAIREVWEETGVDMRPERILCVESGPDYFVRYPNGDEAYVLTVVVVGHAIGGESHVHDEESLEVAYLAPDALPPLMESAQKRSDPALQNYRFPHIKMNLTHGQTH